MINRIFIQHPHSVNETYLEHLWFALKFAALLSCAATAALIHAFIPAMSKKTAIPLNRTCDHIVDQAVLIPDTFFFKRVRKFSVIDFLKYL